MELSLIIPAYNEQDSLRINLPLWIDYINARGWTLILVNDGSKDQTREILMNVPTADNIKIIQHKLNRGYGGALKSGLMATLSEYVITLDADGQHNLASIDAMIETQQQYDADMVIGARVNTGGHSIIRNLGKKFIRWISRILIPNQISDLNSGMKLYKTSLVQEYLSLCPNTMAFSDVITLSFLANRHLVVETPIEVLPRETGKSTINFNTAIDTIIEIVNIVMLFNPLRIFLPLAALLFLAGLAWGIPIVIMGRGVSAGALLALVTSGLCLLLGLIAEQLSKIRRALINKDRTEINKW